MSEEKQRGRPPKPASVVRKGELIVYLQKGMLEDFRAEAEKQEVSMSTLAGKLIEDFLYAPKIGGTSAPTAQEIASEVARLLRDETILGDNLAPISCEPELVLGDKLSPQSPDPASRAAETVQQRGDNGGGNVAPRTMKRRGEGGGAT
ncbi:hypothetical protein LLE49_09685 [Alicyclobacillus tolerans]|uniref:hypothetical protein n=1 Tax=Alicyclobacillus tolerans TaxID=90970 RepID=UPI001F290559|nr:hypothetical protein [Alicyclobacillus tolerans]MCF8564987.1 hypothetical protein [Alicyclobacillus tolerans]